MIRLCQYKDALGTPGMGIHSIRLGNIAIMDVIFTVVGAYFLSKWLDFDFILTLIGLFLLGIILHRIFCVKTTVDKWIFS